IFSLPFDGDAVAAFVLGPPVKSAPVDTRKRRVIGYSLLGVGGVAVACGLTVILVAVPLRDVPNGASQVDVASRHEPIFVPNLSGGGVIGVGVASLAAGAAALLWPKGRTRLSVWSAPTSGGLAVAGSF